MATNGSNQIGNSNAGNTGNENQYTADTLPPPVREEVGPGTHNIPTNAFSGEVRNTGFNIIQVNGEDVSPGGRTVFNTITVETTKKQYFVGAVQIIVPSGGKAWYEFQYLN